MKKNELKAGFMAGKTLCDMLELCPGQECEIFKNQKFIPGDEIIYIPDLWLNDIPANQPVLDPIQQNEILFSCYTGDDFIAVCEGDQRKARCLFDFCDWQHPTSAYGEGAVDNDDDEEELTSEFEEGIKTVNELGRAPIPAEIQAQYGGPNDPDLVDLMTED